MPARKAETVACASPEAACRPAAIAGRLGRYMSMASGPMAVSEPSRITSPQGVRSAGVRSGGVRSEGGVALIDRLLNGFGVVVFSRRCKGARNQGAPGMSALESQMPPVQRAHVNGIEMAYYEAGPRQGVPVILCHGFPELAFSWRHQLKALGEAGRWVVAPDQRGYGLTSRP